MPVLLQETLDGLQVQADGTYVDCTFGGGGHSKGILERLGPKGRLFAFDQDNDAKANLPDDPRIIFVPHNFRHLERMLRLHHASPVNGILADLGVSSHQFDEAERGFSFRFEGDLDMRMDRRQSLTAFGVIDTYSEQDLHKLFERYGEVTNAKTLARTIVGIRRSVSLNTIRNFKTALNSIVKGNPQKWFAQVFQALRIEVNDELGALQDLLRQAPGLLKPHGRIAIITFHSLEDRIVKNFFKKGTFEPEQEDPFGQSGNPQVLRPVTRRAISPGEQELKRNPRSRSAKLRVAEKIGQ
ncbi:MAG: 16S rRNA (cytosine(1402)-N(4))-methyltransferase RsmH [Bacteroidota bacterium]|nr:16S rRNA (cytosine(1402)-N(4))-methyltransferase RsmH [Bacteroidota bacterium]MDP4217504.1 16S rRNA (cytosine(1402)-N(4))-methyltransferase RsmH [Bacteroidota bacterium]MDP4245649.1 16S rRNA (cytosine(1402)-N(4))-methyltransferase RsmH [Bacteroidota bacterium]MDP4252465.1 16S rRNA (cytosine(1402)-N(4))-methyltransferase RsmH [Bacteroidota bacterium]MDP4256649.1 16S rRNA (cytosine(1402)-N(4))-methyltransferase RsmH [Bacteroidota bacterium]